MKQAHSSPLVDTHVHLASSRFEDDRDGVVARALDHGVGRMVTIACDLEDTRTNLQLAHAFPGVVFATGGIHPLYVHEDELERAIKELREIASASPLVAIGEIGLDYYHQPPAGYSLTSWKKRQHAWFEACLQCALDLDLPAVIHQRESAEDVYAVLSGFPGIRAVLHCFNGTPREAERYLEMGHLLSFTGIVTFPSAGSVREAASLTPLDRIMVETDAPYLAPVPHRGKTCEPFMVRHTATRLAELHGIGIDELACATTRNAESFFRVSKESQSA